MHSYFPRVLIVVLFAMGVSFDVHASVCDGLLSKLRGLVKQTNISLNLELLPERIAVVRLEPTDQIPDWAYKSEFYTISRTRDELSLIVPVDDVPAHLEKVEKEWRALKVAGPLDFSLTGILDALAHPLAKQGVSIFALSTYDTDYLLVKAERLEQVVQVLESAGHTIVQ